MLDDHQKDALVDRRGASPTAIASGKKQLGLEKCRVVSFDPITHTAYVYPLGGGSVVLLRVRVNVESQGALTGTGTATAQWYGKEVNVLFSHQGGLYNDGEVIGAPYAPGTQAAPAYAPYQQSGTGRVTVDGIADGTYGNATHTDWETGNRSTTIMGSDNYDIRNNRDTVIGGSNMPRAEEQIRIAATLLENAAAVFDLRHN